MLGLGLSITSVSGLRSLASKLLGILRSRSTYSENNVSSNATIDAIDNAGVLDDATILLTPTAYSNARVHSVKTYTGDEYITNGDFSDGETGWTITGAAASATQSVVNGALVMYSGIPSDANNALSKTDTLQGYNGHIYKLEITASDFTVSPNGYLRLDGVYDASNIITFTASTSTVYFTAYRDFTFVRFFAGGADQGYTIDNVSLIDVSSDFDFDRASSATRINSDGLVQDMQSITDPELVLNGDFEELGDDLVTNGTFDTDSDWTTLGDWTISGGLANCNGTSIMFTNASIIANKTYKVTYTVSDFVSGGVKIRINGSPDTDGLVRNANGTYTEYITSSSSVNGNFSFAAVVSFTGSIDNVSVQQVDPNDRWILGTGWSIANGKASNDGSSGSNNLRQNDIITIGNTYKINITVSDYVSGNVEVSAGAAPRGTMSANGTYTFYQEATPSDDFYVIANSFVGTIDNISVKDITFSEDVDLARINYDSNGENGHWLLEPTSTNLLPYSEDFTTWTIQSGTTVTSNTTETLSPSGEYNSSKIVGNGTSGILKASVSSAGGSNTKSIYIKGTQNGQVVYLKDPNQTVNNKALTLTTEWVRYSLTETQTSDYGIWIDDIPSEGIYMWGGQVEALSYATSYIPTYGSTVTRATETLTGSGNSTLINSTEGVLYFDGRAFTNATDVNKTISLSNQSSSNRVQFSLHGDASRISFYGVSSDGFSLNYSSYSYNKTEPLKVAIKWKTNDVGIFINGTKVYENLTTNTFLSNTLTTLSFADYNNVGSPFYGKVEALAVFDRALTDRELEDLTS